MVKSSYLHGSRRFRKGIGKQFEGCACSVQVLTVGSWTWIDWFQFEIFAFCIVSCAGICTREKKASIHAVPSTFNNTYTKTWEKNWLCAREKKESIHAVPSTFTCTCTAIHIQKNQNIYCTKSEKETILSTTLLYDDIMSPSRLFLFTFSSFFLFLVSVVVTSSSFLFCHHHSLLLLYTVHASSFNSLAILFILWNVTYSLLSIIIELERHVASNVWSCTECSQRCFK